MIFRLLRLVALPLALAAAFSSPAFAQGYPSKPIRMYVGYTAGGAVDIVARVVGQQIAAATGQQVVVENKPGAGTNIAMRALIDSAPDGYTLMMAANALAANPALFQPPPFDSARRHADRADRPRAGGHRGRYAVADRHACRNSSRPRSRNPTRSPSARRATARRRTSRWSSSSAPPASG